MLIPLTKSKSDTVQWTLVEFHGDLKSIPRTCQARDIGNIYFETSGLVLMNIGNHVLEGKVVQLEKPMALIKKIVESSCKTSKESEQQTYTIRAIVRTKLIFLSRAKPLAINPA